MPAFDLADRRATLRRFDVVGEHSKISPRFVQHVALLNSDDREVSCDDAVRVVHMGPPFESDEPRSANVAGTVPLTNDEINTIRTWIAKKEDEYEPGRVGTYRQYIIAPPWKDVLDSNTGAVRYRQYSCAGFVLDAHIQVDVSLLMIEEEALPEVGLRTLEVAYPVLIQNPNLLRRFGLQGNGPWRVVLAGYLLHALDRSEDEIRAEPYVAQSGDEFF